MTNLEFYKEEIKERYTYYTAFSKWTNSLENFGVAVNHISRQYGQNLHGWEDVLDWLCEEHQILDKEEKEYLNKEEKEYLSAVIRPFANRIVDLMKVKDWKDEDSNFEVLEIALKLPGENPDIEFVHLPYFDKGTMYKGMEPNKEYTLKDLGL